MNKMSNKNDDKIDSLCVFTTLFYYVCIDLCAVIKNFVAPTTKKLCNRYDCGLK